MKKTFTKEYIMSHRGCYEREEVESIKCINNKKITLKQLHRDLPINDFTWFLVKKCDLTTKQQQYFALHCAKLVLPIYEKQYPEDNRVRECIEYTEKYLKGEGTEEQLMEKRKAADYAATYAATYAACAAYDAAACAACADDYAARAAAYDADAADGNFKLKVWEHIKTIK